MKGRTKSSPLKEKRVQISVSTSLDGNPKNIIDKLREKQRREFDAKPEDRLKEMFSIDKIMLDSITLPSKVEKQRTIVSARYAATSNSTAISNVLSPTSHSGKQNIGNKIHNTIAKDGLDHVDQPGDKLNSHQTEFSFLPDIVGVSTLQHSLGHEANNQASRPQTVQNHQNSDNAVESSAVDDVEAILSTMHNGDDAISFFARYGSETPIKFIHLISNPDNKDFNPYELSVTTQNEIFTEHFIMSSAGIVHVTPSEQSDCMPLAVWMKQKINFRILRMIPFFKYYLHRKVFNMWFENVRYQMFLKQRKKVTERLFLARKTTNPAILSTKRHLRDIRSIQLLSPIGFDFKPSDKDAIVEKQTSQLAKAGAQYEEFVRRIIDEVTKVINEVNSIHSQAYQDHSSNLLAFADTITPEKLKSLVRLKQEKAERKQMRYRAKIEYQTLPDFVRFMDYVVLENFYELTLSGIEKFYEEFVKSRKTGIFETMIRFTSSSGPTSKSNDFNNTVFSPTCSEIEELIDKLFESVVDTVGNLNRVGYLTIKSPNQSNGQTATGSTTQPVSAGPGGGLPTGMQATNVNGASGIVNPLTGQILPLTSNIQTILHENKQFRNVLELIHQRIATDFDRAEEHASTYDSIKPIYRFNLEWNIESYRTQGYDITQIKYDLERISNWMRDLDKLRNRPIGILDVDSRKLKMELNPILELRLLEIKEYIKEMARYRCQQLLDHYKECITKFSARPAVLKDFCNQIQFVLTSREDEKNLFIQTSQVDQMYNLLQLYDVSIPSEDSVLHEQLHDRQVEYKKEIQAVSVYHEQHRSEMVVAVNENINKLNRNIEKFLEKLDDPDFTMTLHYEDSDTILDDLDLHSNEFKQLNELAKTYSNYQRLLSEPCTEYLELANGAKKLQTTKKLWETISSWNQSYEEWNDSQFSDLDVEDVESCVNNFYKETIFLNKVISCKATDKLTGQVNDFRKIMQSILDLGNKHVKARHLEKLFKLINQVYYVGMPFTLFQIRKGGLMNHKDIISETSAIASGEALLEESLIKIKDTWEKMKFPLKVYREQSQSNVHILGPLDSILAQLEDHQVLIQTMLSSKYIKGLQDRVEAWDKKLTSVLEIIDEWIPCQRDWMYMENIFTNEDIQKQLPMESQKFLAVDRSWRAIMTKTMNDPLVMSCLLPLENAHSTSVLSALQTNKDTLEMIQKSLDDYLDAKRQGFPRLYFASNDELLELLSQTKDPRAIQSLISKFFDNIKSLKFAEYDKALKGKKLTDDIIGWYDHLGEFVRIQDSQEKSLVSPTSPSGINFKDKDGTKDFSSLVRCEGPVETWLKALETSISTSLHFSSKQGSKQYPIKPTDQVPSSYLSFVKSHPSQVTLLVDKILWTSSVTGVLYSIQKNLSVSKIGGAYDEISKKIEIFIEMLTSRSMLDKVNRHTVSSLLLQNIYHRDVLKHLQSQNMISLESYEWIKQLRYYWDISDDRVSIRQSHNSFVYNNEYFGATTRLVTTPLTEQCYLTMTTALGMKQGGALSGPSGTGKTETIKDLSKALGMYCIVFNCSESLDYRMMARFLGGLAQQGAWMCFDEFNHVNPEVLSVFAQQILAIQVAMNRNVNQFELNGRMIPLRPGFGVFLTMNPRDISHVRSHEDLPENLKSLFRPISLPNADCAVVSEALLYTKGFLNALPLSHKIDAFFTLCSQQFDKNLRYDFGLRTIKSVISAAGLLKSIEPESSEDIILLRAIKDAVFPSIPERDLSAISSIANDVFPSLKAQASANQKLIQAIEKSLQTMQLQRVPTFLAKAQQVHDRQINKLGVILVGETGVGKSTILRVLAASYGLLKDSTLNESNGFTYDIVETTVINPRALTISELFGISSNNEWKDGLLPMLFRQFVTAYNQGVNRKRWIVFDGPIEMEWVENLNTVLDETRTLCLTNSERIKLPPTLQIMFEVGDLKNASPASVSRCGVVHIDESCIGMASLVRSWSSLVLSKYISNQSAKIVASTIEANVEVAINFVHSDCNESVHATENHLIQTFLNLFTAKVLEFLNIDSSAPVTSSISSQAENLVQDIDLINALVLWCLIWSIGANIDSTSRLLFHEWCRTRFSTTISSKYLLLLQDPYGASLDLATKEVKLWSSLIPSVDSATISNSILSTGHSILIPTIETTRYSRLIEKMAKFGSNVLLIGEASVGKTMIMNSFITNINAQGKGTSHTINYTAGTSVNEVYSVFDSKLEKKRKVLLGPASGKKFYLFLDDMNIQSKSTSKGDINELIRQVLDVGGYFDQNKLYFKSVQGVVSLGTINPSMSSSSSSFVEKTGGINPRLLRKFHLLWMSNMSDSNMKSIFSRISESCFSSILSGQSYKPSTKLQEIIVDSSISIYRQLTSTLNKAKNRQYQFSLSDMSKVFCGMLSLMKQSSKGVASLNSDDQIVKLWAHESCRVFRDRLANSTDQSTFDTIFSREFNQNLLGPSDSSNSPANTPKESVNELIIPIDSSSFSTNIFGNVRVGNTESDYTEYASVSEVQSTLKSMLKDVISRTGPGVENFDNIIFFEDAALHIIRLYRILSLPQGHALLLGAVDGLGRSTLTKLVCLFLGYPCFSVDSTKRDYKDVEFKAEIGDYLFRGGCSGQTFVILIQAAALNKTMFEDVSRLIRDPLPSYLPFITKAQSELIVSTASHQAKLAGVDIESSEAVTTFFNQSVNRNLRVVMMAASNQINDLILQHPTFLNQFHIDWYDPWPQEALESVAFQLLTTQMSAPTNSATTGHRKSISVPSNPQNLYLDSANYLSKTFQLMYTVALDEIRNHVENGLFLTAKNNMVPGTFLEFIKTFLILVSQNKEKITNKESKYRQGLSKLEETEVLVKGLELKLTEMQPVLEASRLEAEKLLFQVQSDQVQIDKQTFTIEQEVAQADVEAREVNKLRGECQKDLENALPAYEAAVKALGNLDKKAIQELKAFSNPPDLVKVTMEAVCVLFDRPTDWNEARKVLSMMDFMDRLVNFDKDCVSARIMKRVEKYYQDPHFNPEEVKKQSLAAMCLCMWVRAMVEYDIIAKHIEPKRIALREAQEKHNITSQTLADKKANLQLIVTRTAQNSDLLSEVLKKKARLEDEINVARKKLIRAEQLREGLAAEKPRWKQAADNLTVELKNLYGDMAITAGFIAYLGPVSSDCRLAVVQRWKEQCLDESVPWSINFSVLNSLVENPAVFRSWQQNGLEGDSYSLESAAIVTTLAANRNRWPLLIDPQGHANTWIRTIYADSNLHILKHSDSRDEYMRVLDSAIRYGHPVLVEDVLENLDSALDPVLIRAGSTLATTTSTQTRRSSVVGQAANTSGAKIKLGDIEIPYHDNFKLFMTTCLSKPTFSPIVCRKVSVVDFTVTPKGLEDQLLDEILECERPDIYDKKYSLQASLLDDKKQLEEVEGQILSIVSLTPAATILENDELINALYKAKTGASVIASRIKETAVASEEISTHIEAYRPIAARASIIFNVASKLPLLNPMYVFSLAYFKSLVLQRVSKVEKKENIRQRVNMLLLDITKFVFGRLCQGILGKDKFPFALLIALNAQCSTGVISAEERDIFVHGIDANISGSNDGVCEAVSSITSVVSRIKRPEVLNPRPYPTILAQICQSNVNYPITNALWNKCVLLEAWCPKAFEGLCGDIMSKSSAWALFLDSDIPHTHRLPGTWDAKLNDFQKALLTRVLRENMIAGYIRKFVSNVLGEAVLDIQPTDLATIYSDSTNRTPLIFHLSQVSDPTETLARFAKEHSTDQPDFLKSPKSALTTNTQTGVALEGLRVISLGQGQEAYVEKAIEVCQKAGYWLCLENCHLCPSFLPRLEQIIQSSMLSEGSTESVNGVMSPRKASYIHPNFRLWLTSSSTNKFPRRILLNSIKICLEPPKGIRGNFLAIFQSISDEEYETGMGCRHLLLWRKIAVAIAFFHASISERRRYGTLGYSGRYYWNYGDFKESLQSAKTFIDNFCNNLKNRVVGEVHTSPKPQTNAKLVVEIEGELSIYEGESIASPTTSQEIIPSTFVPFDMIAKSFPWGGLISTVGEILYGGHIDNIQDRQTVLGTLSRILCAELLEEEYFKFTDNNDKYFSPPETFSRSAVCDYIRALPIEDSPSAIGLPQNAPAIVQYRESIQCLNKMKVYYSDTNQTESSNSSGIFNEIYTESMLKFIEKFSSHMPNSLLGQVIQNSTQDSVGGNLSSMNVFLSSEINRCNLLLSSIHRTCSHLRKCLIGESVWSLDLREVYSRLISGCTPAAWLSLSYLNANERVDLNDWVTFVMDKVNFLTTWVQDGSMKSYRLSSMFCPQGFLSAVKQGYARKHKTGVESITFNCEVTALNSSDLKHGPPASTGGVYISGLVLVGATFNRKSKHLEERHAHSDNYQDNSDLMPCILLTPTPIHHGSSDGANNATANKLFSCPVYGSALPGSSAEAKKANFLLSLSIPSSVESETLVRRGCALICSFQSK